jgi:putative hydrolase of the HAD superfamily
MHKFNFDFIILDLDDTIYQEVDFVKSGFKYLAKYYSKGINEDDLFEKMFEAWKKGDNALQLMFQLLEIKEFSIPKALELYHSHFPNICLDNKTNAFFQIIDEKEIDLGLITDGRSLTQRNKLKALGIENKFKKIIISEEFGSVKPDLRNFEIFEKEFTASKFCYVADNTNKDFIIPNQLRWDSFCLMDSGFNIHKQNYFQLPDSTKIINELADIFN